MKTPVRFGSCHVASIVAAFCPPRQSICEPAEAAGGCPPEQVAASGTTVNPRSIGLSAKMPDTASGIGPVRSFGSVAEYGLIAEQTPPDTPSQLTGMIESPGPL